MNKDQSIITQVAAKIAADLTPKTESVDANIVAWSTAFDAVRECLFEAHGDTIATAPVASAPQDETALIQQAFPTSQPVTNDGVRVKGKQHGPLPEWLFAACKRDGVTEVWDNRDGLAANPKRPWFKATTGDKAYWAPRS